MKTILCSLLLASAFTPAALADTPLTPFPQPVMSPSSKSGFNTTLANGLYLRLDGTNWNQITGLVWTLPTGGVLSQRSLTFDNAASTTLSPIVRVQQSSTSPATGEDATIEATQPATATGDIAAGIRLASDTYAKQGLLRLQLGNASWSPCSGNANACGSGVLLLTTTDIQGIAIGTVGVDGPTILYGGNVAFAQREMARATSTRFELFRNNAGANALQIDGESGCTGCATSTAAIEYYDTVLNGLELSINNDAFDAVERAVSNFTVSPYTNATAVLTDVVSTAIAIGNYACTFSAEGSESTAADGAVVQWANSGATLTTTTSDVSLKRTGDPGTVTTASGASSLASASAANITTFAIDAHANIVVSVAGNLKIQASQVSHSTGTLTISGGGSIRCERQ